MAKKCSEVVLRRYINKLARPLTLLVLRRKTLFFTCNLIIPCFLHSFLTTFVFYLPDKKITFTVSILVSLTVFFLVGYTDSKHSLVVVLQVLIEIVPPTSIALPMFGQYLLITMTLLTLSIVISVISVNFKCRTGASHHMGCCARLIFIVSDAFFVKGMLSQRLLPRILGMQPPVIEVCDDKARCVGDVADFDAAICDATSLKRTSTTSDNKDADEVLIAVINYLY